MRRSLHISTGMPSRVWVVGALVAVVASWAMAQESPFSGVVVEDSVQARAGAGRAFYPVGELKRGQVVTVRSVLYGWYEVDAPQGVFSYISKAFVDASGDGSSGLVNSDNARIKAASLEGLPHQSYQVQLALAKGTKVQIAGESGDFYKIVPPKGAYVYLPPGAVRRATAGEIAAGSGQPAESAAEAKPAETAAPKASEAGAASAAAPSAPAVEQPAPAAEASAAPAESSVQAPAAEGEAATAVTVPTPAEAEKELAAAVEPVTPQSPAPLQMPTAAQAPTTIKAADPQPQSPQVIEAEAAFAQAKQMPLEQQPVQELLTRYEGLLADTTLPYNDRRIVVSRVYELRRNVELAGVLQNVQKTQGTMGKTSAEQMLAPYMEKLAAQKKVYTAVGRLMASALYDGRVMPRLYRLVDPGTGLTLVYVRPEAAASPAQYLGRIVGVRGPSQYDQALNLQVVTANQIEPLAPPSE